MAGRTDIFDLARLQLSSGQARRVDLQVELEPFEFGGQRYRTVTRRTPIVLDVARTTAGYALRLRFDAHIEGPCMRCLEGAQPEIAIDGHEIDQPGGGDDLVSPYVEGADLDVGAWARDALSLALPVQIVCRDDCRGLCPVCGENLNDADPGHAHESAPDPRFAKLSELRFD